MVTDQATILSSSTDAAASSSLPPKMTTRSDTGNMKPIIREDSETDVCQISQDQQRDADSHDPRESLDAAMNKEGSSGEGAQRQERDPSPPSPEEREQAMATTTTTTGGAASTTKKEQAPTSTRAKQSSRPKPTPIAVSSTAAPTLAVSSSFDQIMAPCTSFGGLSALDATIAATNATPTNRSSAGGTPSSRNGGNRFHHHMRQSSFSTQLINAIPANLPMEELDNPSWDLLNQDSFGFNLLGSQGSLSFDTGDAMNVGTGTGTGAVGNSGNKKDGSNSRDRNKSIDLTSAVTASFNDTPNRGTIDWATGGTGTSYLHAGGDTTIVNGLNHNWIPPHYDNGQHHHHHHQQQQYYGRPVQESRSDLAAGGYGYGESRDAGINFDDPFKYAFGDPNNAASSGSGNNGPMGRNRASKGTSGRRSGGRNSSSSRRSKKRKAPPQVMASSSEPLDGHHSPPPLPTIGSAPMTMMQPPADSLNPAWTASPDTRRSRTNSGRSRRGKSNKHPESIPSSSTWHAAPAYHPSYHHGPPPPRSGNPNDPVHRAFLPPMPGPGGYNPPPVPSSCNSSNAPPSEVYITTKGSSSKSSGGPNVYPPYAIHAPPPYGYPNNVGAPSLPPGGGRSRNRASSSTQAPLAVQRLPQQSGIALLTLPNGIQLSRSQAPGIGWPPEEDLRLTEVMSNHKSSNVNWDTLALEHGMGRTARECHDRWTRYLKPGSRKGQWREEEDAIVLRVIFASGGTGLGSQDGNNGGIEPHPPFTQWADLAPQLPGRTGKQIRDRWVNYLNPAINHLPFSREDDLRLWQGHKDLGKRWVEISVKVFHSTRSENHIKNRWYSAAFKKFIAKEFGMDAYVDAKQAQGGVVGSVMSRDHTSSSHHHRALPVHDAHVRNGMMTNGHPV